MSEQITTCPWCKSTKPPIATDLKFANFRHSDPRDLKALNLNPLMCPDCFGVGDLEDWGL